MVWVGFISASSACLSLYYDDASKAGRGGSVRFPIFAGQKVLRGWPSRGSHRHRAPKVPSGRTRRRSGPSHCDNAPVEARHKITRSDARLGDPHHASLPPRPVLPWTKTRGNGKGFRIGKTSQSRRLDRKSVV